MLETSCSSARKSWNSFWILNGGTIIIQIATNKAIFSLEASPNLEVFPTLQCIRRVLEVVLCLVIGSNHFWNWQKSDQSNVAKMRKKKHTLNLRNHEVQCNFASVQKIKMKKLKKGYMIFTTKIQIKYISQK